MPVVLLIGCQVTEQEPAAPLPDEALVMLQVDPRGVAPDTLAAEVNALTTFLQVRRAESIASQNELLWYVCGFFNRMVQYL